MAIEFLVSALVERFSDLCHQVIIEIAIVKHREPHAEHFVRLEQMADIAARIKAASGTVTVGVDRKRIALIFLVIDIHRALPCEDIAMTRVSGRHNAVKEVDASVNGFENIDGRADTHEIAGLILGHKGLNGIDDVIHHLGFFTDGKTAEGIAGQIEFGDTLHVVDADIVVRTALVDTEQHLIFIDGLRQGIESCHFVFATGEPTGRAVNGCLYVIAGRGIFDAFIERHRDRGSDIRLNLHTFFGTHEDTSAVHVGSELHAFFVDLAELGERKDLETAAVCENGSRPIEKLMDTAHIADNVVARTNVEMIGIGKLDLTADFIKILCGDTALDGRGSAHVHENGSLYRSVNGFKGAAARASFLLE